MQVLPPCCCKVAGWSTLTRCTGTPRASAACQCMT
jgi:hypothetical protein